jgi:hypothetical protein
MKNKIGQIVTVKEDFEIETAIGGKKLQVKEGDKGFVDSRGFIHYTSGKARGKIQVFKDCEVKGYAHNDIASLIFKRLNCEVNLLEMLEDNDIDQNDFTDLIEDILMDIL